jgi:hypothetical protein
MSMTTSSQGREQQVNRFPVAGGSSGSGSYVTDPEINPHSQVWQDVASFRELQQALEFGVPGDREAGASK